MARSALASPPLATQPIGKVDAHLPDNIMPTMVFLKFLQQVWQAATGSPTVLVAALPDPTVVPQRAFVTDSTVAAAGNFGAVVAGGGANIVPVFADGTNWVIG